MPFADQTKTVRYQHPEWPEDYWLDFKEHMTQGDMEVVTNAFYSVAVDIKTKQVSMTQAGHSARKLLFIQMLRGISPALRRDAAEAADVTHGFDAGPLYDAFPVYTAEHLGAWLDDQYAPKAATEKTDPATERLPVATKKKVKPKTRVDALEF